MSLKAWWPSPISPTRSAAAGRPARAGDRRTLCRSLRRRLPTIWCSRPRPRCAARVRGLEAGRFLLDKELPVAAGIGGGSADAAAALRLLARPTDLRARRSRALHAAALAVGADVPVCLDLARAHHARRRRETFGAARSAAACRRCWSIRACHCRRAMCSALRRQSSATAPSRRVPRDAAALVDWLRAATAMISPQPAIACVPVDRRRAERLERPCRASGSRACRGRGRPASPCLLRPPRPQRRRRTLQAEHKDWWIKSATLR